LKNKQGRLSEWFPIGIRMAHTEAQTRLLGSSSDVISKETTYTLEAKNQKQFIRKVNVRT
jgi:hypothetical protein